MLQSLTRDGYMSWGCHNHNHPLQYAHVADDGVRYHYNQQETIIDVDPQHIPLQPGAVIVLPPCPDCGAVTSLKADYTLDELCIPESFNHYFDANGKHRMSALKHAHARNLVLHHMLYQIGKSPCCPELPLAPSEVTDEPLHADMDMGVLYSMWWTYYLMTGSTDTHDFAHFAIALMAKSKQVDLPTTQQKQIGNSHD